MLSVLGVAAAVLASAAFAHEAPKGWNYPFSCCSGYDCREVKASAVEEQTTGYRVPSGETVSYSDKRIKDSPDGVWRSLDGR